MKDAQENAKQQSITIREHNVIYKLIDDIKEEMNNCLPPVEVEDIQGMYKSMNLVKCQFIHVTFCI